MSDQQTHRPLTSADRARLQAFLQAVNGAPLKKRPGVEARWFACDLAGRGLAFKEGPRWAPTFTGQRLIKESP